ncbi:Fc.00g008620.m01.CDS01 [Cosmosporella sp. VM-42]
MRPNPAALIDFFARSLTTFQSSNDAFRVLCTLPHMHSTPAPRRPTTSLSNLIFLDSSFNPPTTAHASMAKAALGERSGRRRLVLLLAVNNADKAPKPASFPVRLVMMEGFGRELLQEMKRKNGYENGGEDGDALEVDLAVTTMPFFHDKSHAITQSAFYATPSQPPHTFLAGFDTLIRIFNPKYYGPTSPGSTSSAMQSALRPFFNAARLHVTMRPDDAWGSTAEQEAYLEGLREGKLEEVGGDVGWTERVSLVQGWGEGVSSSRVREVVRSGEGVVDGLVGEEVRGVIEREGLYRDD